MRTCTKCGEMKSEEDFYWFNKEHTQREWRCKACCVKAKSKHWRENPEHVARFNENHAKRAKRNKDFIINYLMCHPCVDCGENDIQVLQFDHIEPVLGNRKRRVTAHRSHSIARLTEEIEKCEIRCANCHMRRTRIQFGWTLTL